MFEFEMKGTMDDLIQLEKELLEHLGFGKHYDNKIDNFPEGDYLDVAKKYNVKELETEHEAQLKEDYGPVYFLKNFPEYTSPFWNMKMDPKTGLSKKVDVIIHGHETIGSAERSTDKDVMRNMFHTISDGGYADILYSKFSKERVACKKRFGMYLPDQPMKPM